MRLPKEATLVSVLGVDYAHFRLENGDDLYLTKYGLSFREHLHPDNYWTDIGWFGANSSRLSGTSTLYRIRTKQINGRSMDIVLKWSRMGQEIPAGHFAELTDAEFNTPYEEFSLVMELRDTRYWQPTAILTHKPLAIYTPSGRVELWESGRRQHKMKPKADSHTEIDLDMHRSYAMIYEWIKGIDAAEAFDRCLIDREHMRRLTLRSRDDLLHRGFDVRDTKAHHVIVRPDASGGILRDRNGEILYALVDFELLERTRESEDLMKQRRRSTYLVKQRDRFSIPTPTDLPPHLRLVHILDVAYIFGHTESTKGLLWVVGKDAGLFEYFLPEKWRNTPRIKLSNSRAVYHTLTKDNIHLAWVVSRMGEQPDMDPFKRDEKTSIDYGFNSPFEEVALALDLNRKGIPTVYPRAIYMTGSKSQILDHYKDDRRYERYRDLQTFDGEPILRRDHDYITIWGYWNGPDEMLASKDGDYYKGMDALRAYRKGILSETDYVSLMQNTTMRLKEAGIEDLNLRGTHLLLSLDSSGRLVLDDRGAPEVRICNFELLRVVGPPSPGPCRS